MVFTAIGWILAHMMLGNHDLHARHNGITKNIVLTLVMDPLESSKSSTTIEKGRKAISLPSSELLLCRSNGVDLSRS